MLKTNGGSTRSIKISGRERGGAVRLGRARPRTEVVFTSIRGEPAAAPFPSAWGEQDTALTAAFGVPAWSLVRPEYAPLQLAAGSTLSMVGYSATAFSAAGQKYSLVGVVDGGIPTFLVSDASADETVTLPEDYILLAVAVGSLESLVGAYYMMDSATYGTIV